MDSLFEAIKRGDLRTVIRCLSFQTDLSKWKGYEHFLYTAVIGNNYSIVNILFDRGCNLKTTQPFILTHAVKHGYTQCVESLVRHGVGIDEKDPEGRTVLHLAVMELHVDIVRILAEYGVGAAKDVSDNTPLQLALVGCLMQGKDVERTVDIIKLLRELCDMKIRDKEMFIYMALKKSYFNIVNALDADYLDVDDMKDFLFDTIQTNDLDEAPILLALQPDTMKWSGNDQFLTLACQNENIEMVELLLDAGSM